MIQLSKQASRKTSQIGLITFSRPTTVTFSNYVFFFIHHHQSYMIDPYVPGI